MVLSILRDTKPLLKTLNSPWFDEMWLKTYALLLMYQGKFALGLQYAKRSYAMSKKAPLCETHAYNAQILGLSHLTVNNLDSAYHYLREGLEIPTKVRDSLWMAKGHLTLQFYYSVIGDKKMETRHMEESLNIIRSKKYSGLLTYSYCIVMQNEILSANDDKAIQAGKKALAILKEYPTLSAKSFTDSLMYEAYKGRGDLSSALSYLEDFTNAQLIYTQKNFENQIDQINYFNQIEEKKLIIKNQQLSIENYAKNKSILILLIVGLSLILAGFAIFRFARLQHAKILYRKEKHLDFLLSHKDKGLDEDNLDVESHPKYIRFFQDARSPEKSIEESSSDSGTESRKELFREMIEIIEKQKLYLNPDFSQKNLITLLSTNKRYLYEAISYFGDGNFKSIVNRYRMDEVKRLMKDACTDGKKVSSNVYLEAGFNSIASYHRIFKEFTGLTPKEYLRELQYDLMQTDIPQPERKTNHYSESKSQG